MSNSILGNIVNCNRLRIGIDGIGVTTLVAMYGCPLKCKYCINNNLYKSKCRHASVETLYKTVEIDDIYFETTDGGICFGGHEPLLQSEYIKEFKRLLDSVEKDWKITVETSLNVDTIHLLDIINIIDYWIVDIKDMNPEIYKKYTEKDNELVKKNLAILKENVDIHKIKLRIPLIKEFNNESDREKSKKELLSMGYEEHNFDEFEYIIRDDSQ